jgi:FkbM family methyltransferase
MNRALPTFSAAEERNKLSHFTVQGYDLNGIVQAGAGDGEEMENAMRLGVQHYVAFEPLQLAFDQLTDCYHINGGDSLDYHLYQLGLDNFDGPAKLKVTAGDGKGSSLLETVWDHPEIERNWHDGQAAIIGDEEIEIQKFTTWAEENSSIDLSIYDTLQLDTQGNEMEILLGMGDLLQGFKYLCIEISEVPVYVGETPGAELSDWLDKQGFLRDSPITAHNDTFFIRKDIKSETDGLYKGRC